MTGIRINELARELEVPSRVIIEMLPELGVGDKKTHSSSLEPELVAQIKDRLGLRRPSAPPSLPFVPVSAPPAPAVKPPMARPPSAPPPAIVAGGPSLPIPPARPAEPRAEAAHAAPSAPAPAPPAPSEPETPKPAAPAVARPEVPLEPAKIESGRTAVPTIPVPPVRTAPLRPPLAAHLGGGPPAPAAQITPPVAPPAIVTAPSAPPAPAPPAAASPGPSIPAPRTPAPPAPRPPMPPRPSAPAAQVTRPQGAPGQAGQPRPGQILNRPAPSIPQIPKPPSAPGIPVPPPPRPTPPSAVVAGGGQSGGAAPQIPRPPAKGLAGQPAARPVVPPRPDLVARLQGQQPQQGPPRSAPGAPIARPPQARGPLPGQPIHRGPIRPGQPGAPGPGRPGGPMPGSPQNRMGGGPGGRRPMHPTSPLRPEPAVLPPGDAPGAGRRHASKPGAKKPEKTEEEGRLREFRQRREERVEAPNKEITISEGITVKELAEKLGLKGAIVVKKLFEMKIYATINQSLEVKVAEQLARAFGSAATQMSFEEESTWEVELAEDTTDLQKRPPVVTIMGHVDHGKTSLLDKIREATVALREAGGITQHIGAYQAEKNGEKITFIDTPGHEAFTRMRARGAKVTDIVILVVAADDGVMPQTLEAIDHARAAKVPILVAINKMDKPDAQPDRIKQQLNDRGLLAADWGGDVEMLPVSAKTGAGIDNLLETILLVAEMGNFRANPGRPALGNVLEAQLDRGRGPVATVLVQNGTLKIGDYFICGSVFGRVRALYDELGGQVREAEPSKPVEVLGLESLPEVGDTFQVVIDTAKAKQIVGFREAQEREIEMAKKKRLSLEAFHRQMKEGESKELNIIIKADVGGSAEVLADTLQKLTNDKITVRVIHKGVGAITETDVLLATASDAIVVGFNVRPEKTASTLADKEQIDIRLHTIIYELVDEMKKAMVGLLEPVLKQVVQGRIEVREVFRITKVGTVAGCFVTEGLVTRNSEIRVLRDNVVMHTGKVDALKRFKNDASEVKQGFECGISLVNFQDLRQGDVLEAFITEKVQQTFA